MKKLMMLAALTLVPTASAEWTDFAFMSGDKGKNVVEGLYVKNGVLLEQQVISERNGLVLTASITVHRFNGPLTSKELQALSDEVYKVATTCYNASPERREEIRKWVLNNPLALRNVYTTAFTPTSEKSFGPLKLELVKLVNGNAYATQIYMRRQGTPGVAPWINHCGLSG